MKNDGFFGAYGGCYAPETLIAPLEALTNAYHKLKHDDTFQKALHKLLGQYVGRPTPVYQATQLSKYCGGAQIFLKREDLTHTGAHKINNTLGQALIAKYMGKTRLIAETGAGQHGVATATVASLMGMSCVVYMGAKDMVRQRPNVKRMQILGAKVCPVHSGSQTLKDATSEAMRDWALNVKDSHYVLGSALGPHPYPTMVRDFQTIIGHETKSQIQALCGRLPNTLIACVGGGSNAIGLFHPFLSEESIQMIGVEAGGLGDQLGQHAARFKSGKPGVLQGTKTYLLQDDDGNISGTSSISAGLDYPGVGPEHAYLHDNKRIQYTSVTDQEALKGALTLARLEGIIPALESAHALAFAIKYAPTLTKDHLIVVGLSGRGDKDLEAFIQALEVDYDKSTV